MSTQIGKVNVQPYWTPTPNFYMIGQERQNHNDAIWQYGEYSMFILLWNAIDFADGLVQRCPQCYDANDVVSQTYNQPSYAQCTLCYGTSFFLLSAGIEGLGGMKARLVAPAMWTSTDESQKLTAQGEVITSVAQVQSISTFRMRTGDVVIKADSTRWRVATHETDSVISGFQASDDVRAMIGYNYSSLTREDESMPAFLIPPTTGIPAILDTPVRPNYPQDMSAWSITNGELIGDDFAG